MLCNSSNQKSERGLDAGGGPAIPMGVTSLLYDIQRQNTSCIAFGVGILDFLVQNGIRR